MKKPIKISKLHYGQDFYHTVGANAPLYKWDNVPGNHLYFRVTSHNEDTKPYGMIKHDEIIYIEEE